MKTRLGLVAASLLSLCVRGALAHELDSSNSIVVVSPDGLKAVFTFSLTALAQKCGLDEDGDRNVAVAEIEGSLDKLYDCVEPHFGFAADHRPLALTRQRRAFTERDLFELLPTGRLELDGPAHPSIGLGYAAALGRLPAELALSARLHELFGPAHAHICHLQAPDAAWTAAFKAGSERHSFSPGGEVSAWRLAATFTALGVEHILIGFDHILFLFALILLGGRFLTFLKIVTAFTIAHSITLILAALGAVTLPPRLIECAIALSIVYVAAENFFITDAGHRWILTFIFGLVHGFGFANVLTEIGLPRRGLVSSLLAFNLGVELGQVAILLAVFPLVLWASRRRRYKPAMLTASAAVLSFGLAWFIERALGLRFMPI